MFDPMRKQNYCGIFLDGFADFLRLVTFLSRRLWRTIFHKVVSQGLMNFSQQEITAMFHLALLHEVANNPHTVGHRVLSIDGNPSLGFGYRSY